jgi:transposase
MPVRRKSVLDIREMVRRFRLGEADRRIARDLDVSRNTVAGYRAWAKERGLLAADVPLAEPSAIDQLVKSDGPPAAPGPSSIVEPFRALVVAKRQEGVEMKALLQILREQGFSGSYSALRRFVRRLEPKVRESFLRLETLPAEEAQVDFGYVGKLLDPRSQRLRKAWVFVTTLSFSRHQYAEIVFDQRVETWIALHIRAFESFGGVPERVVIDNLRAGIVKAVLHDAEAQRSYRELAEHYGFLISPCRPRTPRHKGKVESGVHYVQRNALAGRSFPLGIEEANAHLRRWVFDVAGVRDHGTTHERPLDRFEREKHRLRALPDGRYEITIWKCVKLHPDGYVVFDYSFYSAPHRLVGEELWLRATPDRVEIHHGFERVATHSRATERGERHTLPDHLPPGKLEGLLPEPVKLRTQAEAIGPETSALVERLLGERPLDRLRGAQGVLRLAARFGAARLEAACRRALRFDDVRYHTVKTILKRGLDIAELRDPATDLAPLPKTSVFARTAAELLPAACR